MSESAPLPQSPLSELAEINPPVSLSGLTPESEVSFIPMADASETGQWISRQSRRLKDVRSGYTSFHDGDVLFAKITPCMENGKGCQATPLVNGIGFGSTEFHVLRARKGHSQRYVYHWTRSEELRLKAESMMTGSAGQRRVPAEFFSKFAVFSPEGQEQYRIAEILDTLDEAIQKTEQLIAKLKQIKHGLLHDLLTRGIDENGQLRDPIAHPEQFKDSVLGRIPKAWEVKKISEICRLGRGRVISQIEVAEHPGVYPVYSSQSKDSGVFGYIDTYDFEGDYVTWTTDGAYAGTVFHRKGRFNCTNVCGTLQARSQETVMEYLAIALARETFKHVSYIGNPKLMNNIMAQIAIALPPELEQEAIVQALSTHDAREKKEAELLRKYHNLKKGLMHDLLTGKVRVTTTQGVAHV